MDLCLQQMSLGSSARTTCLSGTVARAPSLRAHHMLAPRCIRPLSCGRVSWIQRVHDAGSPCSLVIRVGDSTANYKDMSNLCLGYLLFVQILVEVKLRRELPLNLLGLHVAQTSLLVGAVNLVTGCEFVHLILQKRRSIFNMNVICLD